MSKLRQKNIVCGKPGMESDGFGRICHSREVAVEQLQSKFFSRNLCNLLTGGSLKLLRDLSQFMQPGKSIRESLHIPQSVFVETARILLRSCAILNPDPEFKQVPRIPRRTWNALLVHRFEQIATGSVYTKKDFDDEIVVPGIY